MLRILIIEDNPHFQKCLRELLQAYYSRVQIFAAFDGANLLKTIDALEPDLVFMDINLPGSKGIELTRQIHKARTDIVVIVMTGYDEPEYRDAAYAAGAAHFFRKDELNGHKIDALLKSLTDPAALMKNRVALRSRATDGP